MSQKISADSTVIALSQSDFLPVVQNSTNKKASVEQMRGNRNTIVSTGLSLPGSYNSSSNKSLAGVIERVAEVPIGPKVTIVFPTFLITGSPPTDTDFADPYDFQGAIEYGHASNAAGALTPANRAVGIFSDGTNIGKYDPATGPYPAVELEVNLGRRIEKGEKYAILYVVVNKKAGGAPYNLPISGVVGSAVVTVNETATFSTTSHIDSNWISTVTSIVNPASATSSFGPIALLGELAHGIDAWTVNGDSILRGEYDTDYDLRGDYLGNRGWGGRLIGRFYNCPYANLSIGSDRMQYANDVSKHARRRALMTILNPSKMITNLGTNDIGASRTLTNLRDDALAANNYWRAAVPGIKIIGSPVTPVTTSTNSFINTQGQIPTTSSARFGPFSVRGQWNGTYVRGLSVTVGYDDFVETCNFVENDPVNVDGIWKSDGSTTGLYVTVADGIHPKWLGSEVIAIYAAKDITLKDSLGLGLLAKYRGVDFNKTTDTTLRIPSQLNRYQITHVVVVGASIPLTTAAGGMYTAASKTGSQIVASSQVYSALTGSAKVLNIASGVTDALTQNALYFSLTTAQGATATADIYIFGYDLS